MVASVVVDLLVAAVSFAEAGECAYEHRVVLLFGNPPDGEHDECAGIEVEFLGQVRAGGGGRLGGYGCDLRGGGRKKASGLRAEFASTIDEVGAGAEDEVGTAGEHRLDAGFDPTAQSLSAGLVVEAEDEFRSALQRAQSQQGDQPCPETVGVDDLRGEAAQQCALAADESGVGGPDSGAEFEDAEADSGRGEAQCRRWRPVR